MTSWTTAAKTARTRLRDVEQGGNLDSSREDSTALSEMVPQQAEALRRLNPDRRTRNERRWRDSMIYDELPKPPKLQHLSNVKDYVDRWPESAQSWHPGATI